MVSAVLAQYPPRLQKGKRAEPQKVLTVAEEKEGVDTLGSLPEVRQLCFR